MKRITKEEFEKLYPTCHLLSCSHIDIGENVSMAKVTIIGDVSIDDNVFVGMYSTLSRGVRIAKNVTVHSNVTIGEEVAIREGAYIGANVNILERVDIGNHVKLLSGADIDKDVFIMHGTEIGCGATVRESATIRRNVIIGGASYIGSFSEISSNCALKGKVYIGKSSVLGEGVILQDRAVLGGGGRLVKGVVDFCYFASVYKYICTPQITANGEKWVQLGCHNRRLEDWEKSFWNNHIEFPNDRTRKSEKRKLAFELAKQWFVMREKLPEN